MNDEKRRPRIVVLVGLAGCGKSTYIEKYKLPALSSDTMRRILADDETDQSIHGRVFAAIRYLLRHRIALGRPVTYVDATHLTPADRRAYLLLGRHLDCRIEALYFDVPLEVCKERNRKRSRVLPDEVLDSMAVRLVIPSQEEGFAQVWVFRE